GRGVAARTREHLAELREQRLGIVGRRGGALAASAALELLEGDTRLRLRARLARSLLKVFARLRDVAELHVGKAAPVQTVRVDLRDLSEEQELRESGDGLFEQLGLPRRRGTEQRPLIADPGQMVRDDHLRDLRLTPALRSVQLGQVAVVVGDLVPHLIEPRLELGRGLRERALEIGKHGRSAILLATLEELVEALAPSLELARGLRRPRPGDQQDGERRDAASAHSEARAKPLAPASLARPSTRTTSPSTTCRSPARMTTFSLLRDSASRSTLATVPSSPATGRSFTKISLEGVIVTMTPWVSSWLSVAFGRSTSAAGFTMAEVVIMKMMRSTRNTSVSGVTLISATILPFVCVLSAMRASRGGER